MQVGGETFEIMHEHLQKRLLILFPSGEFEFISLMYKTRDAHHGGEIPESSICFDSKGIHSFTEPFGHVVFRPRASPAFIAWAVGGSRNRANWQLTTLKQLRNVLGLITALTLERRDVDEIKGAFLRDYY